MRPILAYILFFVLCACGNPNERVQVGPKWDIKNVKVECTSSHCPASGVLIFLKKNWWGYELSRCTATAISSTTILSNAHCGDRGQNYDGSYFVLAGQRPFVANVVARAFELQEDNHVDKGNISAGRDVAIFKLDRVLPVQPARIAREIPSKIDSLEGYVINQNPEDSSFEKFVLEKRQCRVEKRVPPIGGGSDDRNVSLALFDCPIIPGNSGGAFFLPGDTTEIQVLVNSRWNILGNYLRQLFFDTPKFLKDSYAVAERIHCVEMPQLPPPKELCIHSDSMSAATNDFRAALIARMDQWFATQNNSNSVMEWTADFIEGEMANSLSFSFSKSPEEPIIALIPKPFCIRGPIREDSIQASYFFKLGYGRTGEMETREIFEKRVHYHFDGAGKENILMSMESISIEHFDKMFLSARNRRDDYQRLLQPIQNLHLPICDADARVQARQRALAKALTFTVGGESIFFADSQGKESF